MDSIQQTDTNPWLDLKKKKKRQNSGIEALDMTSD